MKSPLLSLNIYSHSAIIYCSSDKKGGGVEEVWLCHVKNLPDPPLPPRWQLTGSQFSIAPPPLPHYILLATIHPTSVTLKTIKSPPPTKNILTSLPLPLPKATNNDWFLSKVNLAVSPETTFPKRKDKQPVFTGQRTLGEIGLD